MEVETVRQGTVMVLKPDTALVEEDLDRFRQTVSEQVSNGKVRIVLDLSDVPFIDSKGLEALLEIFDETMGVGGGVRIASPSDIAKDILVATRVARRIQVFEDVAEARKSLL